MTKTLKRIGLALAAILLTAVLLVAAGIAYLHSNDAQQRVQRLVNDRIKGNLNFEEMDLSLRRRQLTLHDVRLTDPRGAPVFAIPRIHLRVDPWALRDKALVIERIEIEKPDLNLVRMASGATNIAEAFSPIKSAEASPRKEPTPDNAIQLRIDDIELIDGALRWADATNALSAEARDIDLRGSVNTAPMAATLQASAGQGRFNQGDRSLELRQMALTTSFSDNTLRVDSLSLSLEQAALTITGDVNLGTTQGPLFDLEAHLEAPVSTLLALTGIDRPLAGALSARLDLNGGLADPTADLAVTVNEATLNDTALDPLTVSAHLKEYQVAVELKTSGEATGSLALDAVADLKPLFPKGFTSPPQDISGLSYRLALKADQWNPTGLSLPVQGTVSGTLSLTASGIDPHLAKADVIFDLSGTDLITEVLPSPVTAELSGRTRIENGTLWADQIKGQIADARVDISGRYPLEGGEVEIMADIDAPELAGPLSLFGIEGISGQLKLNAQARGTTAKPTANATISGKNLRLKSYAVDRLGADFAISPQDGVRLSNLVATRGATRVSASAHLPWREDLFSNPAQAAGEVTLDFANLDLGDFAPPRFVTGVIDGRLTADGKVTQPALSLSATGREMTTMGYRLGAVQTRARYQRGRLHVEPLIAENRGARAEINGDVWLLQPDHWRWLKDPRFDLKLTGRGIELADFWQHMAGKATLDAEVSGPWSGLKGTGDLQAMALDFGYQRVAALTTSVRLADKTLFIEEARATLSEQSHLTGQGWLSFDGRYEAAIKTASLELADVDLLQANHRINGTLRGGLQGRGSFSDPEAAGQFDLTGMRINDLPLSDTAIRLALKEGRLELDGQQTGLTLEGFYHLSGHDFQAALQATQLRLTPYFTALGREKLSGAFSGTISLSGNSDALSKMRTDIAVQEIELATPRLELLRTAPFKASFRDGRLMIPNLQVSFLDQGDLVIKGQGGLEGPLDFSARGQIPFTAVEIFTQYVAEPGGTVRIDAQLTGTARNPVAAGELQFDDLSAVLPALNQQVTAINGTLRITDKALTIVDELSGQLDGGRLQINGALQLADLKPGFLNVTLSGYQLPIVLADTMDLTANAKLTLQGKWQEAKLSGQVELIEGLYYKDVNISVLNTLSGIAAGLTKKKRATKTKAAEPPANPFLKNIQIDIGVGYRNPIEVDNNLAELSVAPDLRLQGPAYQLVIIGRAAVEEGVVYYQNNRFIIKRGVIDFINPQRTTPEFDIDSDVTVRQWLINLKVTGPPDALEFELSSNPPLDDQDILSLLLSGKTYSELVEGEGGNSQATARMLADLIVSQYGETIKGVTGLDIIETLPSDPDDDGNVGVKVTLGKNLTQRMQLKYDMEDREGEFEGRVTAEYRFLENIFLSGFQAKTGAYGGALTYRLEFR